MRCSVNSNHPVITLIFTASMLGLAPAIPAAAGDDAAAEVASEVAQVAAPRGDPRPSPISGQIDYGADPVVPIAGEIGYGAESGHETEVALESSEFTGTHCDCEQCSGKSAQQAAFDKAAAAAYAPLFFNNKFDYLTDPAYNDWHLGEDFKRICFGHCGVFDVGGQYRARLHDERNMRGLGLTGVDDDFLLHRTRVFMNGEFTPGLRVYAEFIDAESNYENFPSRPIEVNRADMQNLFADLRLHQFANGDLWGRVGRQELLYGAQRLVSPLDWANTRRNFEGIKFWYQSGDWNVDGFVTRPIVVNPTHFDTYDENQDFAGFYATNKSRPGETIDLYYLHYLNATPAQGPNGLYFETAGGRWQGASGSFLWEFEGAYQFGKNSNDSNHSAGFLVAGLGHKFDHCWNPTLWLYYDWSSGGNVRGARQGFDHLFPLGHKYHGFMDLYARSNIETPNVLFTCQPREKLQLLLWYHYFFLENKNDTPYTVTMAPFNPGNAPASASLGHEIDITLQWTLTPRMDVLFGYSHFFAGAYYELTPGVPYRDDADFFYTQLTVNF